MALSAQASAPGTSLSPRAFGAPARYIQGAGLLPQLPRYAATYGKRCFLLIDSFFFSALSTEYEKSFAALGLSAACLSFSGEITEKKVAAFAAEARVFHPDLIIGLGGGKTLDAAKDLAFRLDDLPVVIVPTIASCDAPTSSVAILYNDAGAITEIKSLRSNPALILVDTAVIAKAPPRFLAAGMGDAVATYFEGRANLEAGGGNLISGWDFRPTQAGWLIAQGCRDIPYRYGAAAMEAARAGIVTAALEQVVEANILLSGVGFENMAVAGAHSIQAGLNAAPATQHALHGEKVAFGILCQLLLEQREQAELEALMDFLLSVGLPLSLSDMGIAGNAETIALIAQNSFPADWAHEPVAVSPAQVAWAVQEADRLGTAWKAKRA